MKTLVTYFSNTGNNAYLAKKLADTNNFDLEKISLRLNFFPLVLLGSKMKISLGIKSLEHKIEDYDKVILLGPVWMGSLISPLRVFLKNYGDKIKQMEFLSCCGTGEDQKEEKFGHQQVLDKVQQIMKEKCVYTQAFPIGLILEAEQRKKGDLVMKARLNEANYKGEFADLFNTYLQK